MNKINAILLLLIYAIGVYKIFIDVDEDKLVAYNLLESYVYAYGFDISHSSKVSLNEINFREIKKELLRGSTNEDINKKIKLFPSEQQSLLFAIIATNHMKNGQTKLFTQNIISSYMMFLKSNSVASQMYSFEIIRLLSSFDDKLSQEFAVEYLLRTYDTYDKMIYSYYLFSKRFARDKMLRLLRDKNFSQNNPNIVHIIRQLKNGVKKDSTQKLERKFFYSFTRRRMPYYIWFDNRRNYPFLSFLCYLYDDKDRSEDYKMHSISKSQIHFLRGGLFVYAEYTTKLFSLMGDYQAAIEILNNLPNNHNKNVLLRQLVPYLASTSEGAKILYDSRIITL